VRKQQDKHTCQCSRCSTLLEKQAQNARASATATISSCVVKCSLQQCNPATHSPAHSHTDTGESDTYLNIGTRPLVYTTLQHSPNTTHTRQTQWARQHAPHICTAATPAAVPPRTPCQAAWLAKQTQTQPQKVQTTWHERDMHDKPKKVEKHDMNVTCIKPSQVTTPTVSSGQDPVTPGH
jgi:hypothetical protein